MASPQYTHVGFADESNWNQGRYRSVSLVSAPVNDARALHQELDAIRKQYKKNEFKWKKANKVHGIALADFFFEHCHRMRVDVLVWDTEDSRHGGLRDRDDKANFARMYYHLLHNVLKLRWPDSARWLICPDEQKEVDWLTLEQCLDWKSWAAEENLFTLIGELPGQREFYNIDEIRPVNSKDYQLVQLADMFAGLTAYSYRAFDKYQQWKRDQNTAEPLFDISNCGVEKLALSKRDQQRLPILDHVRKGSGQRRFQVSLDSSGGLCTKNPANPLNFWLYIPQRPDDRAPVKRSTQ